MTGFFLLIFLAPPSPSPLPLSLFCCFLGHLSHTEGDPQFYCVAGSWVMRSTAAGGFQRVKFWHSALGRHRGRRDMDRLASPWVSGFGVTTWQARICPLDEGGPGLQQATCAVAMVGRCSLSQSAWDSARRIGVDDRVL